VLAIAHLSKEAIRVASASTNVSSSASGRRTVSRSRGTRRQRLGCRLPLRSTSRARPRPMTRGKGGAIGSSTSNDAHTHFKLREDRLPLGSRSSCRRRAASASLPFPVARPPDQRDRNERGRAFRRTRTSGHASSPVGPLRDAGQIVEVRDEVGVIQKEKPSTALSKTTTFTRSSFLELRDDLSGSAERVSGPMRLSGGLSSTTRQYEGVARLRRTCVVFVAEDTPAPGVGGRRL